MTEKPMRSVLIVEDEPIVQLLLVDFLDELGYATLEATDAKTALAILDTEQAIDLLITDVGLPGMNGWDLADRAREKRPQLKVLFITGYVSAEEKNIEIPGSQGLIIKPFDMTTLEEKLTWLFSAAG